MGYPADLAAFEFDPEFAIRGLIFDKNYGNFVKVWGCDAVPWDPRVFTVSVAQVIFCFFHIPRSP